MKLSTRDITFVALFVALITIGAKITIPSPIVPFTMQWMFVLLAGLLLGSRLGAISVIVYTLLGLIGVPVFAKGGGVSYIFSPTFGYLVGFAIAAYVIGKMTEGLEGGLTFKNIIVPSLVGLLIVYTLGVGYMFLIKNMYLGKAMTLSKAIWYGAVLFIPTDLIFCVICSIFGAKVAGRVKAIVQH